MFANRDTDVIKILSELDYLAKSRGLNPACVSFIRDLVTTYGIDEKEVKALVDKFYAYQHRLDTLNMLVNKCKTNTTRIALMSAYSRGCDIEELNKVFMQCEGGAATVNMADEAKKREEAYQRHLRAVQAQNRLKAVRDMEDRLEANKGSNQYNPFNPFGL